MSTFPFPDGWIGQLTPLLGNRLPDFLHVLEQPPCRGVRTRPGLPPPPDALSPIPWAENAWYLPLGSKAGSQCLHEAGAYYLQEPSAMLPAAALQPLPGDRVLDLCAAPGGKSTQLAAYLKGRGLLVCNEPVSSRAQILSRNIERMGVLNAVVVSALPEQLSPRWAGFFDKILVDAPCSGEGMFRRHPESRLEWQAASPAGCAQRQLHILRHAARMLRTGGKMAYSTCTFNAVENEGVIEAFLREQPDFSLSPFSLPGMPESGGMLRLWPHEAQGEGHFTALLQRAEDRFVPPPSFAFPPAPKDARAACEAFLAQSMAAQPPVTGVLGDHLFSLNAPLPPLQGVKTLRVGLQLGMLRGKVFTPDHALALALPAAHRVPVSPEEARAYQRGETLPASDAPRGWVCPTLEGMQLGFGKVSDGQMKNHYPKGLRKNREDERSE